MGRSSDLHGRSRRASAVVAVVAVVAALSVMGGCSSGHSSAQGPGNVVNVTERDFHISVAPTHLRAGDVVLSVHNQGPEYHELIVVRAGRPTLPLRADGVTVDEQALVAATVGALDPGVPGAVRRLRLRLAPGRYEMFCNMAGHYLGGMRTELVVS
jgi:uncharacterized cupredoxin-like copper-binding protein